MIIWAETFSCQSYDIVAKSIHPAAFVFGRSLRDTSILVEVDDYLLNAEEKLYLKLKYKEL